MFPNSKTFGQPATAAGRFGRGHLTPESSVRLRGVIFWLGFLPERHRSVLLRFALERRVCRPKLCRPTGGPDPTSMKQYGLAWVAELTSPLQGSAVRMSVAGTSGGGCERKKCENSSAGIDAGGVWCCKACCRNMLRLIFGEVGREAENAALFACGLERA